MPVDQFDYPAIAKQINELHPDIVWVSLGAPKQETFIHNIFPCIEQGVLFGIGAAFNFYTGDLHNNKKEIRYSASSGWSAFSRSPRSSSHV
ncbi:WecB/TagA/CpsF family glycosyltransferase [Bacteroides ovatus]|nr:WecB/TagA/CpsF family glycosyltransferase [Bacteroides ovatus]